MKTYTIEFEDQESFEIEETAANGLKVPPELFIKILVLRAVPPEHPLVKEHEEK